MSDRTIIALSTAAYLLWWWVTFAGLCRLIEGQWLFNWPWLMLKELLGKGEAR